MNNNSQTPWYQRTIRWGQTNVTELDPTRYDIDWWRAYWRRTRIQGIIASAGGIVAYYPSRFPLHYRAQHLGDRDLFGELVQAAREEGLAVLARMDSNRATQGFYEEHPAWFARDKQGNPYQAGDRYVACIFSDYYETFLADVLREITERYQPNGFTDNSWSGLGRNQICYCENCARSFRDTHGDALPTAADWDSPVYRAWIRWNYDRRLAIWDLNNAITKAAGGPDCLWLGMNSGNVHHQAMRFRDHKAICERAPILMLDYQTRGGDDAFFNNGDAGKLVHGLMGWDKLAPESMAQYQTRRPTFRVGSKPAPEAHLWMVEGYAGGIQPWWHFISAYHEDRRQYRTPVPLLQWHAEHEQYLVNRTPVANVGVVWSQENLDFFGRDQSSDVVVLPYNGTIKALIRARIPYLPIHADHIARDAGTLTTLILPNVGALSDAQVQAIRDFVNGGGNLVLSGQSSLYTQWGDRRDDFALADLLGVHATSEQIGSVTVATADWESYSGHSYMRLSPELRSQVDGPQTGQEPPVSGTRHPVLAGFEVTDILGFGGCLEVVNVDDGAGVPLTFIPPFPIYPPEFAWMRQPSSDHPAVVLRTTPVSGTGGGRIAYLAADIDRLYARYNHPDYGDLLTNIVRWASQDQFPLQVTGPGFIDCHLFHQPDRMVLHLVNLTATGQIPVEDHVPVGPLQVAVQLAADVTEPTVRTLVGDESLQSTLADGWVRFTLPTITAHEVVVIE